MLRFWELHKKKDIYYTGKDKEKIFPIGHYTLVVYPDGASEIFSFRTYSSSWKFHIEDENNFYLEDEDPVFYA